MLTINFCCKSIKLHGQDLKYLRNNSMIYKRYFIWLPKGQLISECLFDVLNFPKTNEKFDKFLPWNLKSGQIIWLRHTIMTLNIINSIFKLNYYKKVHSFCLFDHFLDSRTEICQIFCCFFGKFKISKRHSEINDL